MTNGIYTTSELARIQAEAQTLAQRAAAMAGLLIYGDELSIERNAQHLQDGLQASFSALHSEVLGLREETPPAADLGCLTPVMLSCFDTVAAVIGEEAAKMELQRVIDAEGDLIGGNADKRLKGCFFWYATPQKACFWSNIDEGINPYL